MENFNLNEYVWVKLTDKGCEYMAKIHNDLAMYYPSTEKRNKDYYKQKQNEQGYTRFQMWQLMETFGPFGIDIPKYFETNIKLITKK